MSDESRPHATPGLETFLPVGNPPVAVFRVESGVPFEHACDEVASLLGCIQHLIHEGLMEGDQKLLAAADYLSAMAKAIMVDLERGRSY